MTWRKKAREVLIFSEKVLGIKLPLAPAEPIIA